MESELGHSLTVIELNLKSERGMDGDFGSIQLGKSPSTWKVGSM